METLKDLLVESYSAPHSSVPQYSYLKNGAFVKEYVHQHWDKWAVLLNKELSEYPNRIGILLPNKAKTLIAIGSILLSENIYVPLDYHSPIARICQIIETNCLHALLIAAAQYYNYKSSLAAHEKILLGTDYLLKFRQVKQIQNSSDLAYILNTSGSTGQPKGVMISHENALSFINWASATFSFHSKDVFASIAPFHFDLSIFDIFVSIKHRSSLVLFEPKDIKNPRLLALLLAQQRITVLYATPTILKLLLNYGKLEKHDFSQLKKVLFAGEVFPIEDLKKLKAIWSQAAFFNLYGPTETNVCTYFPIPDNIRDRKEPFPIGKACYPNTVKLAPDGEILVSGSLVTPGYWNRPDLSEERFLIDEKGVRWYKTGDLASLDEQENFFFRGRKDRMVKRRGYRIELDEIEHILQKADFIQDVALLAQDNKYKVLVITCFYVKSKTFKDFISKAMINAYLLQFLPLEMLPDNYKEVIELPKTSTHKINYQALVNR